MQGWTRRWTDPADESTEGPLHERVARARGIKLENLKRFCSPTVDDIVSPSALPGAREVATGLVCAIRAGREIAIYGDYDADGMCAAAILVQAIRAVRPEAHPHVQIPERRSEGYGLSIASLEALAQRGVKTVVTVDCGITGFAEAARAKALGLELLITDHHALDPTGALPAAAAIAHPSFNAELGEVCGAAVAWLVACALMEEWCAGAPMPLRMSTTLAEMVGLAALGTVADVMPLVGLSRSIAAVGLAQLNRTRLPGIVALRSGGGVRAHERVDAEAVSFRLAPLLNACGRLGAPADAVELLSFPSSTDRTSASAAHTTRAGKLVSQFAALNAKRKEMERQIVRDATRRIDEGFGAARGALVLSSGDWSRGVVGIACARLAETVGAPVVLLEVIDGVAHGSGRSVPGYSILEGLRSCAGLLERFGGHASAAGVSVKVENVGAFREALSSHAAANASQRGLAPIGADAVVRALDIDVRALESLDALGPFGHGFPHPTLLLRGAIIRSEPEAFGAAGDHLRFFAAHPDRPDREFRCIWWRQSAMKRRMHRGARVHLVGCAQVDRYGSQPKPAFRVLDIADAE